MHMIRQWVLAASLMAMSAGALAQVTVSGVKYDEGIELRGTRLQLNGAGTRYVTILRYYTAGLYLGRKATTSEEVVAASGSKRISITALREIDSSDLGKRFTRAVEDNMSKADFSKLVPGLVRMGQLFSDQKKLSPGDSFTIDWVPGTGTVISVKGVPQGEPFKEPEFFNAMLGIWLGKSPADAQLKEALLGKTGSSPQAN